MIYYEMGEVGGYYTAGADWAATTMAVANINLGVRPIDVSKCYS